MKRLSLAGPGEIHYETADSLPIAGADEIRLKVLYCAICRTDAKMWESGHRDLVLPRVPGHELVGKDEEDGMLYTLWPGRACGGCHYCRIDRENLCESMEITGFHRDGGFAQYLTVPRSSLVPLPQTAKSHLYCFAEPVACVLNAFEGLGLGGGEKIVIFGGGVLGMLAALIAETAGAVPVVVEKSAEKIEKAQELIRGTVIRIHKEVGESDFDCALLACDSAGAFAQCLTKLRKGGRFGYFSGVRKHEDIEFSLLNLIHYKEIQVSGSYGPRLSHVEQAVCFCHKHEDALAYLVEDLIFPEQVAPQMASVLAGAPYKYIIDFIRTPGEPQPVGPDFSTGRSKLLASAMASDGEVQDLADLVKPVDQSLRSRVEQKIDLKTKPLGALGRIEYLAARISLIQQSLEPVIKRKKLYVFAGDHGVVEEGVSAYPAKVTAQMVTNFLNGGAAINVFCSQWDISLAVVDMGVKSDLPSHPMLIERKIAPGTRNFSLQPAMAAGEAARSIRHGFEILHRECTSLGLDVVGLGEMGIGNSTSATAIISAVTGIGPAQLAGRGTGVDDEGLKRKIEVLDKALHYHRPDPKDALDILSKVGGYELGGICGAVLGAAANGTCIVLDGLISTAAGLLAHLVCPQVAEYMVAGHQSVEHGQRAALEYMGLTPVVDLDMRLGEGTGAAVTINLVELAANILRDMASFEEAAVDRKLPAQSGSS